MIVTKEWLNEWIDLKDISTEKICEVLNNIGLEVDSVTKYTVPKKVVVGKVIECDKHPNADKLSVCKVDVGNEVLQIVCGAKNVAANQFVPVALEGCKLKEGFVIKKAALRGVESRGMICASDEISLPKTNEGIWVLDESLGELEIGKELREYPLINDDVIEIELTANRGDCLSIYGVARDLAVALDRPLKELKERVEDVAKGIGRVVKFDKEDLIDASLLYRYFEKESLSFPALFDLRLAWIDRLKANKLEKFTEYTIHSTGVLIRVYNADLFGKDANGASHIHIKKDNLGFDVVANEENIISVIGVYQDKRYAPKDGDRHILAEASYIEPSLISQRVMEHKIKKDEDFYYRSSRGSEPNLKFGLDYMLLLLQKYGKIELYSGVQQLTQIKEPKNVVLDFKKCYEFIGEEIPKDKILKILRKLGFEISSQMASDRVIVRVPEFRSDISNEQDVIEEIVRMVGINNISSKPYISYERNIITDTYYKYKKERFFREKASNCGFFESVHYCFTHKEKLKRFNFPVLKEDLEILNPITKEMDTLRSTLLINLLEAVERNFKAFKKSVRLFEIGTVFNENREERENFAVIFSGEIEEPFITNHGKPKEIDFFHFARKISDIVGEIEIREGECKSSLFNPYEYGEIYKDDKKIGFISRIALDVEKEMGISKTYVCEMDFASLKFIDPKAKPYSKFPSTSRDLSILIPKDLRFQQIRDFLKEVVPKEIKGFYPIDIYESEEFKDKISLTVRFDMQSDEKTLTEEDINKNMEFIFNKLKSKFNVEMR